MRHIEAVWKIWPDLPVTVAFKRKKNITIRIHPLTGEVRVSAPNKTPKAVLTRILEVKKQWIHQSRQNVLARQRLQEVAAENGGEMRLWGEMVQVCVQQGTSRQVIHCAHSKKLVVTAERPEDGEHWRRQLVQWCRQQLLDRAAADAQHYAQVMDVPLKEVRIRDMHTRWGSCSIQKGRIWISQALVHYDPACLTCIVVHELCHLLESGHNPRFYGFLDQYLPDWRRRRELLRN